MTQPKSFCILLLFGYAGGLFFELFRPFGQKDNRSILRFLLDALFCVLFAVGYIFFALQQRLLPFRLYHGAALLLGIFLYEKTLHKTVAFFAQKVYNAIKKQITRKKEHKAWQTRDRSLPKKQRGSP